ncbi:hypothetical protein FOA52_007207 [Chlamydomonas sp. UWO 241]|nr:hypothetical protein FOA52_007207 [Chlamydomonas sp. UWO 241]
MNYWQRGSGCLALLLLLASVPSARSYAERWTATQSGCTAHPTTARGSHAAPVQDSAISISLSEAPGSPPVVTSLCPGATYTLQVSFPSSRGALVSVSAGTLSDNTNAFGCTNRFARAELFSNRRPAFTSGLTLPCIGDIAGGQLQVRVTSALGQFSGYLQSSATFNVDEACGVNACGLASSPPPSPPPNDSPPPSPVPAPLPSPSPPPRLLPDLMEFVLRASYEEVAADASSLVSFSSRLVDAVAAALSVESTQVEVLSVSPTPARRRARALAQEDNSSGAVSSGDDSSGDDSSGGVTSGGDYSGGVSSGDDSSGGVTSGDDSSSSVSPSVSPGVSSGVSFGVSVLMGVTPSSAVAAPALAAAIDTFVEDPLPSLASLAALYGISAAEVRLLGGPATPDTLPAPAPPAGVACPSSALGYACSSPTPDSDITIHYSISGAMPENACTGSVPAGVPTDGMLHMAISVLGTSGLVGLGFPSTPDRMLNSDVVMGWVAPDGTAMVNSWSVPGNDHYYIQPTNAAAWATFRGVSATTDAAGVTTTTVCFSRPIAAAPGVSVSPTLDLNNTVDLIYAVSPGQYNFVSQHAREGAFAINLATYSDIQVADGVDKAFYLNVHAICMAVAWAGLLPLGALIPRHRWLSCAKMVVGGKQVRCNT